MPAAVKLKSNTMNKNLLMLTLQRIVSRRRTNYEKHIYRILMQTFVVVSYIIYEGRFPQYLIFVLTAAKVGIIIDNTKLFQRKIATLRKISCS